MTRMATPGSELPGGYVLGRLSHADRVGLVYKAQPADDAADQPGTHASASAIVLHPLHVEELRSWFENMAVLGRSMRHPGLVEVLAIGYTHNELPVVVTECVEGRTVRNELLSGRDFPPGEVIRVVSSVADALDYLHGRPSPVLHRVVMPETVLLADTGAVKLLAVGHADRPYHPAAKASALSPEEISGEYPLSAASDVFSLASLAFELITSRAAFPGNAQGLVAGVVRGALPRVALTGMETADSLDAVLHRAWSRDPGLRPPSAGEFAAELAEALTSLPAGVLPTRRQMRNPDGRVSTRPAPSYATLPPKGPSGSFQVAPLRSVTPAPFSNGTPRPASNPPPGLVPVMGGGMASPNHSRMTPAGGSWRPPMGLTPASAAAMHASAWAAPPPARMAVPGRVLTPAPVQRALAVESTPSAPSGPEIELSPDATEISDPDLISAMADEPTMLHYTLPPGDVRSIPPITDPPARISSPPTAPRRSDPPSALVTGSFRVQDSLLPPARDASEMLARAGGARAWVDADGRPSGQTHRAEASPLYAREIRLTLPLIAAFILLNALITAAVVYAMSFLAPAHHAALTVPAAGTRCVPCARAS